VLPADAMGIQSEHGTQCLAGDHKSPAMSVGDQCQTCMLGRSVVTRESELGGQAVARSEILKGSQRSEIAIPLRSRLAINPTCRPFNDRTAPFSFLSMIVPAPTPSAAPAPAAPYTPATSAG
jgi:hypothetical protein